MYTLFNNIVFDTIHSIIVCVDFLDTHMANPVLSLKLSVTAHHAMYFLVHHVVYNKHKNPKNDNRCFSRLESSTFNLHNTSILLYYILIYDYIYDAIVMYKHFTILHTHL